MSRSGAGWGILSGAGRTFWSCVSVEQLDRLVCVWAIRPPHAAITELKWRKCFFFFCSYW